MLFHGITAIKMNQYEHTYQCLRNILTGVYGFMTISDLEESSLSIFVRTSAAVRVCDRTGT